MHFLNVNIPDIGQNISYFPSCLVDNAKGVSVEDFLILLADIFQSKMPALAVRDATVHSGVDISTRWCG